MKINTPIFNDQQKRFFALILLSLFHIFIITASNYFVQIPFEINLKLTALGLPIAIALCSEVSLFALSSLLLSPLGADCGRQPPNCLKH